MNDSQHGRGAVEEAPEPRNPAAACLTRLAFYVFVLVFGSWLCVAVGTWYQDVETPRRSLISQIESAGGRIEYAPWSFENPFPGSRVKLVSLPIASFHLFDSGRTLLVFPLLEELGFADQKVSTGDGESMLVPLFRFKRNELPFSDDAMATLEHFAAQLGENLPIEWTVEEWKRFESSDDSKKWQNWLDATSKHQQTPNVNN